MEKSIIEPEEQAGEYEVASRKPRSMSPKFTIPCSVMDHHPLLSENRWLLFYRKAQQQHMGMGSNQKVVSLLCVHMNILPLPLLTSLD